MIKFKLALPKWLRELIVGLIAIAVFALVCSVAYLIISIVSWPFVTLVEYIYN